MERGRKRLRGGGCGRERIMGLNGKMEESRRWRRGAVSGREMGPDADLE